MAARQVEDIRFARFSGFFPLSLGERVNPTLRRVQSRLSGFPLRDARCSLSLRERVRVGSGWGETARSPSRVVDHSRNCRTGRVLRQSRRFTSMTMNRLKTAA